MIDIQQNKSHYSATDLAFLRQNLSNGVLNKEKEFDVRKEPIVASRSGGMLFNPFGFEESKAKETLRKLIDIKQKEIKNSSSGFNYTMDLLLAKAIEKVIDQDNIFKSNFFGIRDEKGNDLSITDYIQIENAPQDIFKPEYAIPRVGVNSVIDYKEYGKKHQKLPAQQEPTTTYFDNEEYSLEKEAYISLQEKLQTSRLNLETLKLINPEVLQERFARNIKKEQLNKQISMMLGVHSHDDIQGLLNTSKTSGGGVATSFSSSLAISLGLVKHINVMTATEIKNLVIKLRKQLSKDLDYKIGNFSLGAFSGISKSKSSGAIVFTVPRLQYQYMMSRKMNDLLRASGGTNVSFIQDYNLVEYIQSELSDLKLRILPTPFGDATDSFNISAFTTGKDIYTIYCYDDYKIKEVAPYSIYRPGPEELGMHTIDGNILQCLLYSQKGGIMSGYQKMYRLSI